MKTVSRYIADDGSEFATAESCQKYELLCAKVSALMSLLEPIPDLPSCSFANGAGYIKHNPAIAKQVKAGLLAAGNEIMSHKLFLDADAHPSYAGRLIDDMSEKCLRNAWHRFMCMTPDFLEYGQPYFANHPSEAKDVCHNKDAK